MTAAGPFLHLAPGAHTSKPTSAPGSGCGFLPHCPVTDMVIPRMFLSPT